MNHPWYRPINHQMKNLLQIQSNNEGKCIYEIPTPIDIERLKANGILYADDHYVSKRITRIGSMIQEIWVFYLPSMVGAFLGSFCLNRMDITYAFIFSGVLVFMISVFIYLITIPKKEYILNRIDGTITFPGSLWSDNYTMPFNQMLFVNKEKKWFLIRPVSFFSKFKIGFDDSDIKGISFIFWYMDRNRPLPPGTAFDPYRQKDFERRRSEGFSLPIYPSRFATPELSLEHLREKNKYLQYNNMSDYQEFYSRWFDPDMDKGWKTIPYDTLCKKQNGKVSHFKYTFEDGTIVYAKPSGEAIVYPPTGLEFQFEVLYKQDD